MLVEDWRIEHNTLRAKLPRPFDPTDDAKSWTTQHSRTLIACSERLRDEAP